MTSPEEEGTILISRPRQADGSAETLGHYLVVIGGNDLGKVVEIPGTPLKIGRDARHDQAILDATLEILLQQGYRGVTIEGVAARAGVGRPTIYRRWPSKPAVVVAALVLPVLPARAAPAGSTFTIGVDQEVVGLDPNLVARSRRDSHIAGDVVEIQRPLRVDLVSAREAVGLLRPLTRLLKALEPRSPRVLVERADALERCARRRSNRQGDEREHERVLSHHH